jgi:cytochrome c oxidase subunit 1
VHFWLTFIGFHMTFLVQHWLGANGMARRYADYLPTDSFTTLNTVSTIGSFVLGGSTLVFLWNVQRSYRFGEVATADDPWGYGNSLEWATTSPPPRHNFYSIPKIRSERPAFELHYPHLLDRLDREAHAGSFHRKVTAMSSRDPDEGSHIGGWGTPLNIEKPGEGNPPPPPEDRTAPNDEP